jgi:hypothetical protein
VKEDRARLLVLLADALPDEWETAVHQAVERADRVRGRLRVAAVAAAALTGAGCDLGADFTTLLVERREVVVALRGEADHGLLVRTV